MISEILLTVLLFLLQPQTQTQPAFLSSELKAPLQTTFQEIALPQEPQKGTLEETLRGYIAREGTRQTAGTSSSTIPSSLEKALSEAKTAGTLTALLQTESEKMSTSLLHTRQNFVKAVDGLEANRVEEIEQELMLTEQILVSTGTYAEHQEYNSWIELLIKAQSHLVRAEILLAEAV